MTFFTLYRGLKGAGQEVEYNMARAFQHLGLQSLAIQHYEAVLTLASTDRLTATVARLDLEQDDNDEEIDDFAKAAAYNLSSLYMFSGSPKLARALARRWLSI